MTITAEKERECLLGISDDCSGKHGNATLRYGMCYSCIVDQPYIASKLNDKVREYLPYKTPSCYQRGMTFSDSKQRAKDLHNLRCIKISEVQWVYDLRPRDDSEKDVLKKLQNCENYCRVSDEIKEGCQTEEIRAIFEVIDKRDFDFDLFFD